MTKTDLAAHVHALPDDATKLAWVLEQMEALLEEYAPVGKEATA